MKKSHRKDVIIARIIFAVICAVLILLIVCAVVLIKGRMDEKKSGNNSQSESIADESGEDTQTAEPAVAPEPSQVKEPDVIMQTTADDLRLRKEPNTDCEVITVLEKGTKLELLSQEDGWAFVDCQGQTGYVSMDYLEEVTGTE